jgi:hypothetical protein
MVVPDPLWQKALIATIGPVVTAISGLVIALVVTQRIQSRREAGEVRERLASAMSDVANELYFELQRYWRAAREVAVLERRTNPSLAEPLKRLDDAYHLARAKSQTIEHQLNIYFSSAEPGRLWHSLTDMYSVRYFLLWSDDPNHRRQVCERNAGPDHSRLSAEELANGRVLLDQIRRTLPEVIASLWRYDLDPLGRHLRDGRPRRTWDADPSAEPSP